MECYEGSAASSERSVGSGSVRLCPKLGHALEQEKRGLWVPENPHSVYYITPTRSFATATRAHL